MTKIQDVAIFDFDKTIFKEDSIVGICEYLKKLKILEVDIWSKDYKIHQNAEANSLLKKLRIAELFNNLSQDEIEQIFLQYAFINKNNFYEKVFLELLKAKNEGCTTICLSASFESLVSALLSEMNISFDIIAGTKLKFDNLRCTGNIDGLNLSGFNKFLWLKNWMNSKNSNEIKIKKCYTDHISDSLILLMSEERYVVKSNQSFDDWSHHIDGVKYIFV